MNWRGANGKALVSRQTIGERAINKRLYLVLILTRCEASIVAASMGYDSPGSRTALDRESPFSSAILINSPTTNARWGARATCRASTISLLPKLCWGWSDWYQPLQVALYHGFQLHPICFSLYPHLTANLIYITK